MSSLKILPSIKNYFRADLHTHTICSDGTLTPFELWDQAKAIGLQGLAITDHDTLDAYEKHFLSYTKQDSDLQLIYGAEFSASCREKSVHILAYGMNLKARPIKDLIEKQHNRRTQRNCLILEKLQSQLKKEGRPLPSNKYEEYLHLFQSSPKPLGRPHIADLLVQHHIIEDRTRAFQSYLGDHAPCYVPGDSISIAETIDAIKKASGLAILAHPHLLHHSIVKQVLASPFDGIEGYYARFAPHDNQRWITHAQNKNWIVTGGSDFHGAAKENNILGSSWTPEETFNLIVNLQNKNNTTD
jgi:predicted metal-dependent phosphoesterase TrpH